MARGLLSPSTCCATAWSSPATLRETDRRCVERRERPTPAPRGPVAGGVEVLAPVGGGAPQTPAGPLPASDQRVDALEVVRLVEAAGRDAARWREALRRVVDWFAAPWGALVDDSAPRRLLVTVGALPPPSMPRAASVEVAGGLRLEIARATLDADERRLLDTIALQLGRAWRRAGELEAAGVASPAVMAGALDRLAFGVLLVAGDGAVRFANTTARELLAARHDFHLLGGHLLGGTRLLQEQLGRSLAEAAGRVRGGARGLALRLPERPGECAPLEITVVPTGDSWLADREPLALLLLSAPGPGAAAPVDVLRELYGLTPAEARVARALLIGHGVPETAAALGLRPGTVRSHLKQLYAKLGTTRQSDLVRLLLAGPGRVRWG